MHFAVEPCLRHGPIPLHRRGRDAQRHSSLLNRHTPEEPTIHNSHLAIGILAQSTQRTIENDQRIRFRLTESRFAPEGTL
jgi:hypothetical protein